MKTVQLAVHPVSKSGFAAYGDVVETEGAELRMINQGSTERFHDLAAIDVSDEGGRPIVSLFRGRPFAPPIEIAMMERHPLGSQLFYPVSDRPFLAVVAADEDGRPGAPVAFLCPAGVGVNYAKNTWHHPLLSLEEVCDFVVVDRDGPGTNLEEYDYPDTRYRIDAVSG